MTPSERSCIWWCYIQRCFYKEIINHIWFVCLYICFSLHSCYNSRVYSSNDLKLIYTTHLHNRMFRMENRSYRPNNSCTRLHKIILIHNSLLAEIISNVILHHYAELNAMKLKCVIHMYKSMFSIKDRTNSIRVQDLTKCFEYIMNYAWNWMEVYF